MSRLPARGPVVPQAGKAKLMDDQQVTVRQFMELDAMQPAGIVAASKIQPIKLQNLGQSASGRHRVPNRPSLQPDEIRTTIAAPQLH
jgi:hypothetical protein